MLLLEDIAHSVMFPQPDGGVHHQPRHQTEDLVPHSKAQMLRDVGWVHHVHLSVSDRGRIDFSVDDLKRHSGKNQELLRKPILVPCELVSRVLWHFAHSREGGEGENLPPLGLSEI